MKYIAHKWDKQYDGILYFVQRLEEMLFHYSSDIARTPIHNTRTLIEEYLQNENEMKKGRVKAYQLDQILSELRASIESDKILIKNLGEEFVESVVRNLPSQQGDMVRYLKNKIPNKTYFEMVKQYLQEQVVLPSHKDEIEFGLRAWIVEIVSYGHSSEYVYKKLHSDFSTLCSKPSEKFNEFILHFSLEKKDFRVYFAFSPVLSDCKKLFEQRLSMKFDENITFEKIKKTKNDFVGYMDIQSYDRYTAIEGAYAKIGTFLKYYRVMSNRKNELVRKFGKVKEMESGKAFQLPIKSLGYRSIEIEPKAKIDDMVDMIIIACQSKPKETYSQINKMIDLHNQAIKQPDLNDGFINLWSILEIACADSFGDSKIDKVLTGIVPILQKDYFAVMIENISSDLKDNLSENDFKTLLDRVQSNNKETDLIAQFIFLPEYEDLREEYFKLLSEYPIIRTKIYRLWELRESAVKVLNLAIKYTKRIKWHIYRLYRTRNAIVHSGDTHRRIQMLGEHLHVYVDRIIYELLVKLATEKTLKTVSDVLIDTKLSLKKTEEILNVSTPISTTEIKAMLESYFYTSKRT